MKLRPIARIVPLGLSLLLGLIASPALFATTSQNEQNITISPSSSLITVAPGATATKTVTVVNGGSSDFTVDASVQPYHVEGDYYDPQFTQLPGTVDPSAWVKLSQTRFAISSHKVATLTYTVHPPASTAPGGYYAVVFAQTDAPATQDYNGVIAHNRVGNILYITVSGPVKTKGSIGNAPLPEFLAASTIPITTKVSNSGGLHFLSTFSTSVHSFTGKQVFSSSVDRYVLPQTTRAVTTDWNPVALAGVYKISRSATILGNVQTLPDTWVIFTKPQLYPIIGFGLITVIGLFIILRRRPRQPGPAKSGKDTNDDAKK